jgi:hypothetical protein
VPARADALTSPSASRRFSPARSDHRADRRRRSAVRVHRPRRPAPRRKPRTARIASWATDRARPRDHRGDLPTRDTTRG